MPAFRRRFRIFGILALGLSVVATNQSWAQASPVPSDEEWQTPLWVGDVTFLSANAILGGITAGVLQAIRGHSFQEGFARGALGGAMSYGGRRIAVEDFWGAGLLGRQVSAVGGSVIRNASEARPALARLSLPVGPLNVYVRAGDTGVNARLDVFAATWLLSALVDDRLELDGGASLSAGAPVFRAPRHRIDSGGAGMAVGGLIVLGYDADFAYRHDVFAHERVHVLQYDFQQEVWGDPLEEWIGGKLPGGTFVLGAVRPGLAIPSIRGSAVWLLDIEWADRPWEIEAEYLERR